MPTHPTLLPLRRRFAEAALLALFLTAAYVTVGALAPPHAPPLPHLMDRGIPFVPETVWIYLPGYWACFLVPVLVIRDARQFRAALVGLAMLTVIATPFFVLFPIAAPRAPVPTDGSLTAEVVRWLYTHDPAGNTFPSLHVANATYCAVITTAASRRWGAVVWGLALGVTVSVLTLKQHWVVDIPAAWGLAGVGLAAWRAQLAAPSARSALPTWVVGRRPHLPSVQWARVRRLRR